MPEQLELPQRMAALPRDKVGRPVPWFVAFIDGVPDFRVIGEGKMRDAVRSSLCWVCGKAMGRFAAFTIGPMCAVNRVSAEPPSHRECAVYSARACPFLSTPTMNRRDRNLPEHVAPAGIPILRNPGVTLVWVTRSWRIIQDPDGHPLFQIGDPEHALWYAEGRDATRAEVVASIESGLPILRDAAREDGPFALAQLSLQTTAAMALLPVESTDG